MPGGFRDMLLLADTLTLPSRQEDLGPGLAKLLPAGAAGVRARGHAHPDHASPRLSLTIHHFSFPGFDKNPAFTSPA